MFAAGATHVAVSGLRVAAPLPAEQHLVRVCHCLPEGQQGLLLRLLGQIDSGGTGGGRGRSGSSGSQVIGEYLAQQRQRHSRSVGGHNRWLALPQLGCFRTGDGCSHWTFSGVSIG